MPTISMATQPASSSKQRLNLAHFPLEVLSNIVSCLPPPFYPPPPPLYPNSLPPHHVIDNLDPHPPLGLSSPHIVSSVTKTSTQLLEAARPWLWENVDVRSGRGWLAIVDALTEEVIEDDRRDEVMETMPDGMGTEFALDISQLNLSLPLDPMTPVSPEAITQPLPILQHSQAHPQPNTVPGGFARYVSLPSSSSYTYPYPAVGGELSTSYNNTTPFPNSPPHPTHLSLLLTPPGSRNSSPNPLVRSPSATARLRARSRSPRRSVGFDTEGISAVLERSRSGSQPRAPLQRRQSSLSRSRIPQPESSTEDEDEEREILTSPETHDSVLTPPPPEYLTLVEDAITENVNPELLPPPGPYIRHLSFVNFRTIGSRRSQEEAVRGRFVTGGRLEGVIKNAPNLVSLCMTEYVDSALIYPVIEELFFRGLPAPRMPRRASLPGRSLVTNRSPPPAPDPVDPLDTETHPQNQLDPPRPEYVPYETETEEQKWKRREMFTAIEALDLTGCISGAFGEAMADFGDTWLGMADGDERGRGRSRRRTRDDPSSTETEDDDEPNPVRERSRTRRRTPMFPALRRLSLRACRSLPSPLIENLVLSLPCLTHLDLSSTRVSSALLIQLTTHAPPSLHLQSLSLARCPRLDPTTIVEFICLSPATRDLVDLNLYVDPTQSNQIESDDLTKLLSAPCFKHGRLRYLDISSANVTPHHLEVFPPQPSLVSMGLSHIPHLPLQSIATFLQTSAPNIEILTLIGTSAQTNLRPSLSPLQIMLDLHKCLINPLTTVPFSLKGLDLTGVRRTIDVSPGPSRLRVIEFGSSVRHSLGPSGGSPEWKVVRSKGGRGWYVDISAGWMERDVLETFNGVLSPHGPEFPPSPVSIKGDLEGDESMSEKQCTPDHGEEHSLVFIRHLPSTHPKRQWLAGLAAANGKVGSAVGWHSRKMEVIRGMGMIGREEGMGGAGAFAFEE